MTSLRRLAKRALLPRRVKVRTLPVGLGRGLRMEIDFAHQTRFFLGRYETELDDVIRELARPGVTTFDIGAQFGYESLVIARLTAAPVLAVECFEGSLAILERNVAANPDLAPLVDVVGAFVGEPSEVRGVGGFAERSVAWHREISDTPTVTLDELVAAHFAPGLVKLDIEGAELSALRGATRLLAEHRPAWIVEVHNARIDAGCRELLAEHGYEVEVVEQRSQPRHLRDAEHNRWLVARPG